MLQSFFKIKPNGWYMLTGRISKSRQAGRRSRPKDTELRSAPEYSGAVGEPPPDSYRDRPVCTVL